VRKNEKTIENKQNPPIDNSGAFRDGTDTLWHASTDCLWGEGGVCPEYRKMRTQNRKPAQKKRLRTKNRQMNYPGLMTAPKCAFEMFSGQITTLVWF